MAGGKGASWGNDVLNYGLTTGTVPARPTSWTMHLFTDATGLNTEPTTEATTSNCPGYAAQNITFAAASGDSTSNNIDVAFIATGGPWATINYWKVIDNNGETKYWGPLSTSRTLQVSGDKIDWASGQLVIKEA